MNFKYISKTSIMLRISSLIHLLYLYVFGKKTYERKMDRHNLILASIKLALIYPPLSDVDVFNTTREWSSVYKPNY